MSARVRETVAGFQALKMALLLHCVPYIGEVRLTQLLHQFAIEPQAPADFVHLSAAELKSRYHLDPRAIKYILSNPLNLLEKAEELARTIRYHNLLCVTRTQASYPLRLETNDPSPPPILYALGRYELLDASSVANFTFTVVVSNGADPAIYTRLEQIAYQLLLKGGVPITGHDRLPYQRLALCAQRQKRPVIYILDRGLREALGPAFESALFSSARIHDIAFRRDRDVVLSPFRLDDHCLGEHNRLRDRLVLMLADIVVALDVRADGVMLAECLRVLNSGRTILVADGGREGNTILRQHGCKPLSEGLLYGGKDVFRKEWANGNAIP